MGNDYLNDKELTDTTISKQNRKLRQCWRLTNVVLAADSAQIFFLVRNAFAKTCNVAVIVEIRKYSGLVKKLRNGFSLTTVEVLMKFGFDLLICKPMRRV